MTVIRRIMLGFAGLMVLVSAMVAVGVAQLSTLQSGIRDYSESTRAQVEAANAIKESAAVMESAVLISVVRYHKEDRELQSARLDEGAAAARTALDSMQALAAENTDTQASLAGLRDLLDQYHLAAGNVIALSETAIGRHGTDQPGHREHQPDRHPGGGRHAPGGARGQEAAEPRTQVEASCRRKGDSVGEHTTRKPSRED